MAIFLTVVPSDQSLVAQLLAPSEVIGFLRAGAPVLVRYQAFPYQKFGQQPGRVAAVSRAALNVADVSALGAVADGGDGPVYRITVQPASQAVPAYGRSEPLQAGMQVEAHVLVDRRPLYQWLLEPLFSLRGTLVAATGADA